jgi:hypothetical protein
MARSPSHAGGRRIRSSSIGEGSVRKGNEATVRTSPDPRVLPAAWLWVARLVAAFFLLLGALALSSSFESGSTILLFGMAALGLGGGLIYIFGLERPEHRLSRWARPLGWLMMTGSSLFPTSLLFVPLVVVLFALPPLFLAPQRGARRGN